MKDLIGKICSETAFLEVPNGVRQGMTQYNIVSVRIRRIVSASRNADAVSTVANNTELLIMPPAVPDTNCRILYGGKSRKIKSVRICEDLDGTFIGSRVSLEV